MKVYELMAILAQKDPNMEIVIPCAPYGGPVILESVSELNITGYEENLDLDDTYLGLGYTERDNVYNDCDDLPEDEEKINIPMENLPTQGKFYPDGSTIEIHSVENINDELIPETPEDFEKLFKK